MKQIAIGLAAATAATLVPLAGATAADPGSGHDPRTATYRLAGDPEGSRFEGIGVDRRQRRFYVSETTGGEIHRGDVLTGRTREWKPAGADGRATARGITVDRQGRVYVAGGPNGIGSSAPDLWVYDRHGNLEAKLRAGVDDAFLNDVAIGPDGAAYFTDSNSPQLFRVAKERGTWRVTTWADAGDTIETQEGFNLGGIVLSANRRSFVVAQGNTGDLWRIGVHSRRATHIETGGANLLNADGLVRRGQTLYVVRNVDRKLARLRLGGDSREAALVSARTTDQDRVLTTAEFARGRLLAVDSKFDETTPNPPYEVVTLDPRR